MAARQGSSEDATPFTEAFGVRARGVNLPKGGGAIRGIGEKFGADPVTGSASMTIPLFTSPGRSGFGPQLALSYDSSSGNGPFGLGWNLPVPAVTRKTDKGLPLYRDYDDSDVLILAGAEDLVPFLVEQPGGRWTRDSVSRTANGQGYRIDRFRPRIEGTFTLIERWVRDGDGDTHWRTVSRDNVTTIFGAADDSRIADPADQMRVFSWLVSRSYDDRGNVIVYEYKPEDYARVDRAAAHERNRDHSTQGPQRYLKTIRYGNLTPYLPDLGGPAEAPTPPASDYMFTVVFDYGEHNAAAPTPTEGERVAWPQRSDPFSTFRAGFEVRTHRLCQRVLMFHNFPGKPGVGTDCLVRSTDLAYQAAAAGPDPSGSPFTYLQQARQTGYKRRPHATPGYLSRSTPPVEFTYSRAVVDDVTREIDPATLDNLPVGISGRGYQWVDLDGEGLSGVLTEQAGAWYYKPNLGGGRSGPTFGPATVVSQRPAFAALGAGRQQLLDLAGDGELDLVDFGGENPGLQERTGDDAWRAFTPFASLPNIDWTDLNLRFVDLTGDGRADVLITEEDVFRWHPSLAEDGFAGAESVPLPYDEEAGPRLVFADGTQTIFTADMSGDGLHDIVRIRNGEVCYWPNVGYGRFGARITLDHAPCFDRPGRYDPGRIRLADVDGSGPTDILYLGDDGARLYVNRSGNALSDPRVLPFPVSTEPSAVQVADLLGDGTACLVWSSALPVDARTPARYLDLMGGQKPHLLTGVRNNLGAETTIEYAPSTKFYVADRLAGRPWITRLPFPVHVVERVIVKDQWRGTSFSSRYSYHHGSFDGDEREFRGFARTERVDVEAYGPTAADHAASPYITSDRSLYQPPVKTITWMHTGVAGERGHSLSELEHEYFPNSLAALPKTLTTLTGFQEKVLAPATIATADLTAEEWRQALRACKGTVLRQEIYELDVAALEPPAGTAAREIPVRLFSAAAHGCEIRRIQPQLDGRFAVFQVLGTEAVTYEYELDLRPATLPVDPTNVPSVRPDPRVTHALNLTFDPLGNVCQSIAVGYRRMQPFDEPDFAEHRALIRSVQAEELISYTETRYTDVQSSVDSTSGPAPIRHYRLPVPCEVQTYELTGITRPPGVPYFRLTDLADLDLSARYPASGSPTPVARKAYHDLPQDGLPTMRLVEHVRTLFFEDDPTVLPAFLTKPLALGRLGRMGLVYENYKLALTATLLEAVLEERFDAIVRTALDTPSVSGYQRGVALAGPSGADQWWLRSGRAGYGPGAATQFFLPERFSDPFENEMKAEYDSKHLFVESASDALGNTTIVVRFDYRVLAPAEVKDANVNRTEAYFDVLGRVIAVATKGKGAEGDSLAAYDDAIANPNDADLAAVFAATPDEATLRRLLGAASTRYLYHFGEAFSPGSGWLTRPPGACAVVREQHAADLVGAARSPLQVAFECSDGQGALLMKRSQAEPEHAPGPLRWIVSGKTVFNNKGKPVKQYEPYFSDHAACLAEGDAHDAVGVTPLMYYDALGRLIRTEMPDGTFSRVEFSPWQAQRFDANDTVDNSQWFADLTVPNPAAALQAGASASQRAAWLAARDAGTPSTTILDGQGREVIAIDHNRVEDSGGTLVFGGRHFSDALYVTFTKLDAEGNPLWIRDPRGNLVVQHIRPHSPATAALPVSNTAVPSGYVPAYDVAGCLLFQHSMDAGDRWTLADAESKPLFAWDTNQRQDASGAFVYEQRQVSTTYDRLRRPVARRLVKDGGPPETVERWDYIDVGGFAPLASLAAARSRNLCGRVYRHFDAGGLTQADRVDFKGNALEVSRRLPVDHRSAVCDWQADPLASLDAEIFTKITEFDALNRVTRAYNWHRSATSDKRVSVNEPRYNERGLLVAEQLVVGARRNAATTGRRYDEVAGVTERKDAIGAVVYDAKGQRLSLAVGSGTTTLYDYDPKTMRLRQLRTTRRRGAQADPAFPGFSANLADQRVLQQLRYTYDPVGNIVAITDEAYKPVFWAGGIAQPTSLFEYDSLYRLVSASGRETAQGGTAAVDGSDPATASGFPITDQTLRQYTQTYRYDEVGNFTLMNHVVAGDTSAGWARHYETYPDSNRLHYTWTGSSRVGQVEHRYDAHGNMLNVARVTPDRFLDWDYRDMIATIDLGGGGTAHYQYDAGKQRTRKRIDNRTGDGYWERIDLGGYELYRRFIAGTAAPVEEIETVHLTDGQQRLLMVDQVLRTTRAGLSTGNLYRFALSNHLGSSTVEVDEGGGIISHEEFHPYGTTAYQSGRNAAEVQLKRYRYTGMERDDESGFNYHGARYLAEWLGRWTSCDPSSLTDGPNMFTFARCSPIRFFDPNGQNSVEDLFKFLRDTGGYAAARTPKGGPAQFITTNVRPRASAYGVAAHQAITDVLGEAKAAGAAGFKGIEQIYSEVAVQHGTQTITRIGGSPIRGHHNLDLVGMPQGTPPLAPGQTLGTGAAEAVGDAKFGGGEISQAHAGFGKVGLTVNADSPAAAGPSLGGAAETEQTFGALSQELAAEALAVKSGAPVPPPSGPSFDIGVAKATWKSITNADAPALAGGEVKSLTSGEVVASAKSVAGGAGKVLSFVGNVAAVAGAGFAGYQVGTGINDVAQGKTGSGVTDIVGGAANLGLAIGVPAAVKAGTLAVGGGAGALALVTGLAGASIAWAVEDTKRALRGEKTMTDIATDYWSKNGVSKTLQDFWWQVSN